MRLYILILASLTLLAAPRHGFTAEETIILDDGISVRVLYFEPENSTEPPPLAILISGGYSDEFMARAQFWLGKEMVERGWAIAVPISDQGRKFFVENGGIIPAVVERLRESHTVKEQKPMLLGISSGGSAALAIAAATPELYQGVIATPGRIWDEEKFTRLAGLPVFLRVGEKDDFRWNRLLDENATLLRQAGANVNAALVPNAHHIFALDWEELETWLRSVQNTQRMQQSTPNTEKSLHR